MFYIYMKFVEWRKSSKNFLDTLAEASSRPQSLYDDNFNL